MGKCTSKAKTTGDVTLVEVSQSFLGVRTRAKTLALQRLQSSAAAATAEKLDYLELRSRRLEKPPLLKNYLKSHAQKQRCNLTQRENQTRSATELSIGRSKKEDGCFKIGDAEIEASFGENNLELEDRGRSTRESTPISLIRTADSITAPGSSTKQRSPNTPSQRNIHIPTSQEIEEFFTHVEQSQQKLFIDKYNFDVVNDVSLPGRYEWLKVMP